ncbi:phosphatidate cytidylyltransferase [Candidatus Pelagibacter sp. HIMB1710]
MTKYNLVSIFGSILILFSFYAVYRIRNDFNDDPKYLLLILIICVSTDIGGFIFGKLFKGPKLSKISPNKTFSGVIGSYLFSLSAAFSFIYFFELNNFDASIYLLTLLIFLISTISQIGDLTISYFKRLAKIKDTGKVIPGHGGILDRIDGMIFVFFFLYIFLLIQKILL